MSGQRTPEWHAARSKVVGGSEIAALFGCQPAYALSHYALWMVKAGRAPPPPVGNERVWWGNHLEDAIAEAVAIKEGLTVAKGGHMLDETTPGMGCTLDYIITGHAYPDYEGQGALELKNVDWLVHKRSWTEGEPPPHILLQLQHQLACTGFSWGIVGAFVGGNDLRVYRYRARPKIIAEIRRRVTDFWASIEEDREPPVDGSDGAAAVLRAMYAVPVDEEADLTEDNELPEICAGLLNVAERRRAAEAEEKTYKNRLVAKLGPHLRAKTQGYRISVVVTPEKPDRPAEPGEVIKGRAEARRYNVKEWVE